MRTTERARTLLLLVAVAGCACGGVAAEPVVPAPAPASAPAPVAAVAVPEPHARWRSIAASDFRPPAGADVDALALELVSLLDEPDPRVRDGLGYEILAAWILHDPIVSDAGCVALTERLRAGLRPDADGSAGGVLRRSFSALVLSVLAARDVRAPFLDAVGRGRLLEDALRYAASEHDYRGRDPQLGWIHAAAHTADLLKFLARNSAIGAADQARILDAVLAIATRSHGHNLHHGEDARLGQAVLAVLRRDQLAPARVRAWLEALVGAAAPAAGPYDAARYARERNARNLLFTVYVTVALEREPPPLVVATREIFGELLG